MAGRPGKVDGAVHLSPDEIERRTFAIEDRGYDRDEVRVFLLEVAAALRLALHTTRPPMPPALAPAEPGASDVVPPGPARPMGLAGPAGPAAPAGSVEPVGGDRDDFTRLGSEVAEVLRSAHEAVAALHRQADAEVAARHEEAVARADEVRRQAEVDATWTHDRAKRVLIAAQEQADAIVADAESGAAEVIATARRQAREHADQVATRTRRHAEQILRAEREALRRLHQAQAGVAAAVEMLTGSETRPVVDLTELRPNVRLGSLSVEVAPDPGPQAGPASASVVNDPLARMIRSAVDRAAEHARTSVPPDEGGPAPDAGPTPHASTTEASTVERPPTATGADPSARVVGRDRLRGTAPTALAPAPGVAPVAPVRVVRSAGRADLVAPAPIDPSSGGTTDDGAPRTAR